MNESTTRYFRKLYQQQPPTEVRPLLETETVHWVPSPFMDSSRYIAPIGLDNRLQRERREWMRYQEELGKSRFARYVRARSHFPFPEDYVRQTVSRHGVFADAILLQERSEVGHKTIDRTTVDPLKWEKLHLEALGTSRQTVIPRDWAHIDYQTFKFLMRQVMLRLASEPSGIRLMTHWYEANAQNRICELCGKRFELTSIQPFLYRASLHQTNCCFTCKILENPTRQELNHLIPTFVATCGFIPPAASTPVYLPFTSRIDHDSWLPITVRYAEMGGMAYVLSLFSSWFHAMAITGALPDAVQVTSRGIRCLARDGHVCHSLDEQTIDNWLTDHGLEHEREPPYPSHNRLNPGALRADFRVGDAWIEYFGLTGEPKYDTKTSQKLQLADELGLQLIALYPRDMLNLHRKLAILLPANEGRVTAPAR